MHPETYVAGIFSPVPRPVEVPDATPPPAPDLLTQMQEMVHVERARIEAGVKADVARIEKNLQEMMARVSTNSFAAESQPARVAGS